jgi:ribosome production factor 2
MTIRSVGALLEAEVMPEKGKSRGRAKRVLRNLTESKAFEDPKGILCIRGSKTTEELRCVLKDIAVLCKPHARTMLKRNLIRPFEDPEPMEFLSSKNGTGLFVLATHSKKRPFSLTIGRVFGNKLLDMVELGLSGIGTLRFKPESLVSAASSSASKPTPSDEAEDDEESQSEADPTEGGEDGSESEAEGSDDVASSRPASSRAATPQIGFRPVMVFNGPSWESDPAMQTLRSLLLDLFQGHPARPGDGVLLTGITWCVGVSQGLDGTVHLRTYSIELMRSGMKTPKVVLKDMGFHMDFAVRRQMLADAAMMKEACKLPPQAKIVKAKNVSTDGVGDKYGRVHMKRQDFGQLKLKSSTGVRMDRKQGKKVGRDEAEEDAGAWRAKKVKH